MSQTNQEVPGSPSSISLHFDPLETEVLKLACGEARQDSRRHDRPTTAVADVIASSNHSEDGLELSVSPDFMLRLYNIVDGYVAGHSQRMVVTAQAEARPALNNIVDQCSQLARRGVLKVTSYYRKNPTILDNVNWKVRMHTGNIIKKLDEKTLDIQTRRRFIMTEADQRELERCDIYDDGQSAALLSKIGQAILDYTN